MSGVLSLIARHAAAGPWNIEPSLGVSADYDSDPGLRSYDIRAEEHVAALIDFPLRYDTDELELTVRPSARVSDTRGYDSLASNYYHLDADAVYRSDLWSATLLGNLGRDSSLYFIGGLLNGLGVRRDTADSSVDITRNLSARSQLAIDASWTEVRYAQPSDVTSVLTNYRYLTGGPTFEYSITERTILKLLGSASDYQSLNQNTQSKSYNAQLGVVRQLSETWTVTITAGYVRAINSEKIFFGPFYLGTVKANENGDVYSATLARQGERINLSATASHSLQPTGLAFLSRVDSAAVTASLVQSEYWDYALTASWQHAINPVLTGQAVNLHYLNVSLAANWHWTPQWTLGLNLGHIRQEYEPPRTNAASYAAVVSVTRRFLRREL